MSCPNPLGPYLIFDGVLTETQDLGSSMVMPGFQTSGFYLDSGDSSGMVGFQTSGYYLDSGDSSGQNMFTSIGSHSNMGSTII